MGEPKMGDISEVKKNLKKWENEFYTIHNKRPDKTDIETAPDEVRELYSRYSKLKKLGCTPLKKQDNKCEENNNKEKTKEVVWGAEFNRSTEISEQKTCAATNTKLQSTGGSFLDKIGDAMFQNSKKISFKSSDCNKKPNFKMDCKSKDVIRIIDKDKTSPTKPFTDETPVSKPSRTFQSSAPLVDSDSDMVINSFGSLKSNSLTKIHQFQSSLTKASKQCEADKQFDLGLPQQFRLPSKPRLSLQSIEMAKQQADKLKSKMEASFNADVNDFAMETDADLITSSVSEDGAQNLFAHKIIDTVSKYNLDKVPKRDYVATARPTNYVDTPRPRPTKSRLPDDLMKQPNFSENEDMTSPQNRKNDFDFQSDDNESPIKTSTKKRKASNVEPANKRQKITVQSVPSDTTPSEMINNEEEEEERVSNQPIRRAAPASKRGINENFVRLNMKCKKYKRKGGGMTGGKYKRQQWKNKMDAKSKTSGKCYICDLPGHWSNNCPEKGKRNKKGPPVDSKPVDENDFLSLKQAAMLAKGVKSGSTRPKKPKEPKNIQGQGNEIKEDNTLENSPGEMDEFDIEADLVRGPIHKPAAPEAFEAFYSPNELMSEDTPQEMKQALKQFGFQSFRPGQEQAMKRILCGLSTLVVLSTGEGKSLCYQLPSFVYGEKCRCLTLVVSPLVSLMEDQITGLPPGVNGACLHANMTKVQKDNVFTAISEGKIHFLLVSPEAVVGGAWSAFGSFPGPDKLPPIAFVCIDEAHCLSEWSHNFRPSYLRLCKILRDVYGVKCFLGLTATATKSTALDVAKHLGIEDDEDAVIRGSPVPKNLLLSVSRDVDKDEALINLLQGERFTVCQSIIIYCTRREQANRIAAYIRTCLQKEESLAGKAYVEPTKTKGKKKPPKKQPEWSAECYHAGLTAAQRKRVQKNFMSGKLRVVVATVAFGMGLDKSDVRAVLHYNMPKSFESYVQEIGRAGRDRQLAHCHLFLDPEGKDINELRRHTHGNTIDRYTLRKLLQQVFKKCRCKDVHEKFQDTEQDISQEDIVSKNVPTQGRVCQGHERALCIEDCVMGLDVREEGIYTLLCYLELHVNRWVDILSPVYTTCEVKCYGGPVQLQAVSKKCPPLAVAIAKKKMEGEFFAKSNSVEFHVVEISDSMGWESAPVKRELKQLQWTVSPATGGPIKSGVMVEFSKLGFHFRSPGDLSDEELDDILDFLYHRVSKQESNELYQLDLLSEALKSVSYKSYWMCADDGDAERSNKLKNQIEVFFDNECPDSEKEQRNIDMPSTSLMEQFLTDVRQFYNLYGREHNLTGRSISRIFHGIGSPCFPVETWGRVRRFWRCNLHIPFNLCLKLATRELLKIK